MEKTKKLLFGFKKLTCLVIVLTLVLSIFGLVSATPISASALEPYTEYGSTDLSVRNGHFNNNSSAYPATATDWTSTSSDSSSPVISGIIELKGDAYSKNIDKIGLKQYPEYQNGSVPQTPFGKVSDGNATIQNSSSSALLINTNGGDTVFGYNSSTITLSEHGFYMISVWAKTGDFSVTSDRAGVGASVSLKGFEEDYAFTSINTVKGLESLNSSNNYGWKEFVFYVATDYRSYTITLNLSVGYTDNDEKTIEPAKGYALFDTVTAYSVSPENFENATASYENGQASETETGKAMLIDCDKSSYLTAEIDSVVTDIGSFKDYQADRHIVTGWTPVTSINGKEISPSISEPPFIYSPKLFASEQLSNLPENPVTPFGLTEKGNNILLFNNVEPGINGLQSAAFTVKKNQYYKIGFWTNSSELKDNSYASAALVYAEPTDPENEVVSTIDNLEGNSQEKNYGWVYNAFFIKGSAIRDYKLAIQLWLGYNENASQGIAMFDEIKTEVINYEIYNDYSENFTAVDLSTDYTDSSSITNGNFIYADNYDEYGYPMPPANWNTSEDIPENVIAGMFPKDDRTVWTENNIAYPFGDAIEPLGNALIISSGTPISFGYKSSDISLSIEKLTEIDVRLQTQNGAKAYIVAKYNGEKIAFISGVSSENKFKDFKFYLKNNSISHNVIIEIWLGQPQSLSSGTLIVEKVSSSDQTDNYNYDTLKQESFTNNELSTYDFSDIFACDATTYSNGLMNSYAWSYSKGNHAKASSDVVNYGILYLNNLTAYVPEDFNAGKYTKDYLFFAEHTAPTASTFNLNQSMSLTANTFYEIRVTAKIDIPLDFLANHKDAVGLGIKLTNTNYSYKNIIDSRVAEENGKLKDNNFKTYSFYIAVGSEDAAATAIELTFGGTKNTAEFVQGKLYVSDVTISEISESVYNDSIENLVEYNEKNRDKTAFGMKVNVSENLQTDDTETDEETTTPDLGNDSNLYWYVVPSVLFGIFLLLALLAVIIRKFSDKISNRKRKEQANSYDRENTLHIDVNNDAMRATKKQTDKYESFDEDAPQEELNDNDVIEEVASQSEESQVAQSNENESTTESKPSADENQGENKEDFSD